MSEEDLRNRSSKIGKVGVFVGDYGIDRSTEIAKALIGKEQLLSNIVVSDHQRPHDLFSYITVGNERYRRRSIRSIRNPKEMQAIINEFKLIQLKTSKLSKRKRDAVETIFHSRYESIEDLINAQTSTK